MSEDALQVQADPEALIEEHRHYLESVTGEARAQAHAKLDALADELRRTLKGIEYRSVDALDEHGALVEVNPRAEVPAVLDGDVVMLDSTDIVYYLYPTACGVPTTKASSSSEIAVTATR